MEQEISDILEGVNSYSENEIEIFLNKVEALLKSLLSSINLSTRVSKGSKNNRLNRFLELQNDIRYNIAGTMIDIYKYWKENLNEESIRYLIQCNTLLQGLLLLHPPSRELFHRNVNMRALLHYLDIPLHSTDVDLAPEFTISIVTTLIHILLKDLYNFRTFEQNQGCSLIIRKLHLKDLGQNGELDLSVGQDLNFKIIEFLVLYLVDETDIASDSEKRTINQKASYFKNDFNEIDILIDNLNDLKSM